ncbi:crotonase/enoyl-CoA hydratase family protein [Agrobacterium sp. BA1120]|uniref:crotonase/enoyl-CoA hydratase family protein n=1 Tax=Agrobacterium sp. BA1120 TaxID=3228927 RepID=UPI00336A6DCD
MEYETLQVSRDKRGVVSLTLNRPDKRNAMTATMIAELSDFAAKANADDNIRAIILAGNGQLFCAGGDLSWMMAQIEADREARMREARKLAEMLRALNELRAPLIGKVHGAAFGGGIGLACICDVVIAADETKFGLTETKLGIIPATIGPYVLARIGEGFARRVFMSARLFDAAEAAYLGLIKAAVPVSDLDEAVEFEVAPYLKVAPQAVGRAKALARSLSMKIDDAVIDASVQALADSWESDEAREGISAFLEKRPPRWAKYP